MLFHLGIAFAMIWAFTHYGVKLSMRTVMIFGGLEILIMLALSLSFLIRPGLGSSYVAPITPSSAPNHYTGIIAGMVFSILALSGFEAPAPLAQESRNPARLVSAAITLSLLSIGIFYVFTSYATAIGWGTGDMASFATDPNPPQKGNNVFRVKLTSSDGTPAPGADVTVTFYMAAMPAMGMAAMNTTIKLTDKGNGMYEASGSLGSGGTYQVTISVQKSGQVIATKQLRVNATGGM